MLKIETFGPLRVVEGEHNVKLTGPLTRILLAWLVLHEGEHTSRNLKYELSTADLRPAVHVLKRLERSGAIRIKPGRSGSLELLRRAPGVSVDYDEFKRGIRDDASRAEQSRAYELGIAGELFQGLGADEDSWHWLMDARRRQTEAIVELCRKVADTCENEGNLAEAVLWTSRWYELEPTNEVPARLLANRLTAIDEHSKALVAVESYVDVVTARGVTPSEGFSALVDELRHGRTIWRRSRPVITTVPQASEVEFVHRTILTRCRTPMRLARDERQIVLIEGEAGVGKTRLCAAIAERWEQENPGSGPGPPGIQRGAVAVLYGRFDHEAGEYSAFGEALNGYLAHWKALPPEHGFDELAPELTRIPSLRGPLRDCIPSLREPPVVDDGTDRSRLFTAVHQTVQRIAHAGPVLLILDDLHEADRDSLALLGHCIANTPESPLMYLCTFRPSEKNTLFVQTLYDDHPDALRLVLEPFDATETRDLASIVAGRTLSGDEVADVHRESGGLPLEIEEIARTLEATSTEESVDPQTARLLVLQH
jgi:DNA-binding SARP family transcriptional activator